MFETLSRHNWKCYSRSKAHSHVINLNLRFLNMQAILFQCTLFCYRIHVTSLIKCSTDNRYMYTRVHVLTHRSTYIKVITKKNTCICSSQTCDFVTRYHELRPLLSYFPCHWVVPVDFPNTFPKIVKVFYRIIARYGRDIYTITQSFPNQQ